MNLPKRKEVAKWAREPKAIAPTHESFLAGSLFGVTNFAAWTQVTQGQLGFVEPCHCQCTLAQRSECERLQKLDI